MSTDDGYGERERGFRVVAVDDLPAPHNLFRCKWKAIHQRLVSEHSDDAEGRRRAFAAFIELLGPERIAACEKHQTDWRFAAEIAVALAGSGRRPSEDEVERAVREVGADDAIWWAVDSFFNEEPIFLNGDRLGAGQHRTCALKMSGATACPLAD